MKKLSILLILALLLGCLAACSGGETHTTAAPETASAPVETAEKPGFTQEELAAVHPMLFHVAGPEGREGWLFGTIHVGDDRNRTALEKLTPWLEGCDALAVEFDLVAYQAEMESNMSAALEAYMPFLLTDGTTVDQHMPAETYEKAYALLGEAGLMPGLMRSYNVAMWAQLAEEAALMTRTDYETDLGMDQLLIQRCYEKQIQVRDVESAAFQMGLLAGFSEETSLLLLENTLSQLDAYGESIDALYNAWLKGDLEELEALVTEDVDESGYTEEELALLEDYNDQMLTQRNLGMRDKALQWLEAGDRVFFAVGAAHLVGEEGLIALLRAAGYTVEQVGY